MVGWGSTITSGCYTAGGAWEEEREKKEAKEKEESTLKFDQL